MSSQYLTRVEEPQVPPRRVAPCVLSSPGARGLARYLLPNEPITCAADAWGIVFA